MEGKRIPKQALKWQVDGFCRALGWPRQN